MSKSVDIVGLDETQARLVHMGARARKQTATFQREAKRAQRMVSGVPVDTGRLSSSTRGGSDSSIEVGPWGYALLTHVPYADFVFRGTRTMPARPPHVPSSQLASSATQAVARDLDRAR